MASDGRKRRSFLPAPKKSSTGLPSPSSSQSHSSFDQPLQQQQSSLQYQQPPSQQSRISRPQFAYQHHHQQQQQQQQQQYQQYRYQQERPQYQQQNPQQQEQNNPAPPQQQSQYNVTSNASSVPKKSPTSDKEPVFGKGLRVGAKVRIGGVKPGIIRYLGTTHLAPGIFCGIELFDPEGSHDGEVNGHRYFFCAPKHGIFAPKERVCLDTSSNPLARVYDSDVSGCSSTESLAEKSNQAFRKYSEGDVEAVEVSPSSPERTERHGGDRSSQSYYRSQGRKADLNSTYDLDNGGDETLRYDSGAPDRPGQGLYSSRSSKNHRSLLPSFKSSPSSAASLGHHPLRSSSHTDSYAANEHFQHISAATADCNIAENISPIPQSSPSRSSFSYLESSRHSSRSSSPLVSSHHSSSLSGSGKSSEDSEEDGLSLSRSGHLSTGVKKQLSGDNRRYLNFTFDREKSDGSIDLHNNTFEVVNVSNDGGDDRNTTFDINTVSDEEKYRIDDCDNDGVDALSTTRTVSASDLPDILIPSVDNNRSSSTVIGRQQVEEEEEEEFRWAERACSADKGSLHQMEVPPPSSSKTHDSSKKTEEITTEPPGTSRHNSTGSSSGNGGDTPSSGAEPKTESSSDGSKGDNVDDSSNGISPEASQTLEWDYGQEFEGKVPVLHLDNNMSASASTGTSESLSDVMRDVSEHSDGGIEPEFASGISLESDQFEVSENDFESIDKLEDFTFFGKDTKTIMTDSGISEKDIEFSMAKSSTSTICGSSSEDFSSKDDDNSVATTKAASSDSSQETIAPDLTADTPVSTEVKELPGESYSTDVAYSNDDSLSQLDSTAEGDDLSCSSSSAISVQDITIISEEKKKRISPRHSESHEINQSNLPVHEGDRIERQVYDEKKSPHASEDTVPSLNLPKLSKESVAQLSAQTSPDHGRRLAFREEGGGKKERPVSLISTASADTGYAPDTDSELGTLTANTPLADWVDQQGRAHPTSFAPLDDDVVIDSPVDADLIVKESLALSRALCRPNFGSQSSTSNASDTDDYLVKSQQQQLQLSQYGDLSSSQTEEGGDVRLPTNKDDPMSRSILSASMIQDTDLIGGVFGDPNMAGDELKLLDIRSHVDMNASIDVTDVDDRVEADRVQETDGGVGDGSGMETLAVVVGDLDASKNVMVGSGIEAEVGSAGFVDGGNKNDASVEVKGEGDGGDESPQDKSKGDDVESNSKKEMEEGKEADSSMTSTPGKRKYKPLVQKRKRMDIIDHKMPNTKVVASRLADYIKTPTPTKPKDEQQEKEAEEKKKLNKNVKNIIKKRLSLSDTSPKALIDGRETSVEKNNDKSKENNKEKAEKFEKPKPPVIKRTPPKSKWGNIMSQIDHNKTVKPKPKSEIKSSLASYLSNPIPTHPNPELMNAQVMVVLADDIPDQPPQPSNLSAGGAPSSNIAVVSSSATATSSASSAQHQQQPPPAPRREFKSRIKPLPPPPPKIDLSKVKSKLGAPTAASARRTVKREASPAIKLDSSGKPSRDNSPATTASSNRKLSSIGGKIVLNRKVDTLPSSARSSRTDLSVTSACVDDSSVFDESTTSKASSSEHTGTKKERRQSTNSVKSGVSDKSKSKTSEKDVTARTRPPTRRSTSSVSPSNPSKRHSRTLEIHLSTSASPARSSRHSSTSPTPIIIKAVKTGNTLGRAPGDSRASTIDKRGSVSAYSSPATRVGANSRGNNSSSTISKSRIANGTTKAPGRTSSIATTGTTATKNKAAQEIERLESLCEARTKELTQTKIQLKASHQAFDAMSVLLNYCCTELNAFECPQLATNLAMVQKQLTDCLAEITELTGQKETLTKDVEQMTKEKEDAIRKVEETTTAAESEKEEHSRLTKELDTTHNAALTAQRDELTTKHNAEVKKLKERHDYQMQELMQNHERSVSDTRNETKMEMNGVRLAHLEEIQSLRNKHDSQMEELHKQHRNKLEDITLRFETIKLTLSEKVESLKGECEDHLRRARCSEEALQKDADVKVQMAIAPYLALPKEIDSLKTVVEMRNEEIQKLKTRNTDLESQLEELPIAKEKIISLQQKVENLEAVINIKTDHEKQLHERCQVLMRKCDRETRANKRLSMDYEQVVWRMSQSEYEGSSESLTKRQLSRSPPRSETTSPDPRRRGGGNGNHHTSSPNNGEVRLREKKKRCESESDRNLRSRSATFVIDRHNDNSGGVDAFGGIASSPPSSPRNLSASSANTTPLRWKTRPGRDAGGLEEMKNEDFNKRMCQSAGAELISSALNGGGKNSGNVSDYNQKTGYQLSSSSQFTTDSAEMMIDDDMMMMSGGSYARSLSGVSDSGICDVPSALNSGNFDSMTGSEMLNSSVFSTDSDWVGGDGGKSSANASMSFDSSVQNSTDFSSGSNSGEGQGHEGDFVKNSNTVVDMSSIQSTTVQGEANTPVERDSNSSSSMSESVSYFQSSCSSMDDTVLEKTLDLGVSGSGSDGSGKAIDNYEFQIKLPDTAEEEEDVFETSMKQQ